MDYKMKREEEGQLEAIATIWVKKEERSRRDEEKSQTWHIFGR